MITRKTGLGILLLVVFPVLVILTTAGFAEAMSADPGTYHVFGRVLNQEGKGVKGCSVILIKQMVQVEYNQQSDGVTRREVHTETSDEAQVATTDADGNFNFMFEPLSANDFWVFLKAESYKTRSIDLNKLMKSRFFKKPNKSPLKIDVVLERE